MKQLKPLAVAIGSMMLLGSSAAAYAIDTNVQFSTDGSGTYDVTGINEFDWQSSGDLGIQSAITVTSGGVTTQTTLAAYFGGGLAATNDIVVFDINAQARLNDMLGLGGGTVAPSTLDANGLDGTPADAGFEITAVLAAQETATVTLIGGVPILSFTGIKGTTTWYYDPNPNSVVDTGAGFTDGTAFLTADLVSVDGLFNPTNGGSSLLGTQVTSYDTHYIQTDPLSNAPLIGTTFDTLVSLRSSTEASATDVGDLLGGHIVAVGDVGFKADANSEFSGVPEPGTLFLLGAGLLGLVGVARRRTA